MLAGGERGFLLSPINKPETKERFIKFGDMVKTRTPKEAQALIDQDTEILRKIIECRKVHRRLRRSGRLPLPGGSSTARPRSSRP
jgi:hypothetical protein